VDKNESVVAKNLFVVLRESGFWGLVDAWIYYQRVCILRLQTRILDRVKRQARQSVSTTSNDQSKHEEEEMDDGDDDDDNDDDTGVFRRIVTEEMILLAQRPHRRQLMSLFIENSTLIPLLLQKSEEEQCDWLCRRLGSHFFDVDRD
jgi:hypothetical protein